MESPPKLAPALQPPERTASEPSARARRVRAGAALAVALTVAFGAWLVLRERGVDTPSADGPVSTAASIAQLRTLSDQTGHPVYWAGRLENHAYELTRPTDGNVYVRYLPPGVRIGDPRPDYTTVGTYPRPHAMRSLRRLSRQPGTVRFGVADGGIAVYGRGRPSSVYLAFPGQDVQVEVYDPAPQKARRLARSGRVRPIG
jgi:hypothetical protein